MKYCKECIMPESYPGVSFDHEGICNLCTDYKPQRCLGEGKLVELIASSEKKGEYDSVVPLSGGKDSTYILYHAVKKLKLKCIAVMILAFKPIPQGKMPGKLVKY
jgi:hypothetical protein